ncbi:hypothetical protein GGR58DRAFT_466717 [Xylaria digitata]|nr:hypothetical protein GGR58DRAFT_466717 [Xylaria digitata]
MPSQSIIGTSLLVFRENSRGQLEVFVRFAPEELRPNYCLPYRELSPGSDALDCALNIGKNSLQMNIPTRDISYEKSVLVHNTGDTAEKVRVFIVESRPGSPFEAIAERDHFRGWKYAFVPARVLDPVWVYPRIDVTTETVQFMILGC